MAEEQDSISSSTSASSTETTEDFSESGRKGVQANRLFIGNLPYKVSWQDLKDHMRGAGEVVYATVLNDGRGRSRGCGIVEYATHEQAVGAIAKFHDTPFGERNIFVREDREDRTPAERTTTSSSSPYKDSYKERYSAAKKPVVHGNRVFVGNLSYRTAWQDLKDHMRGAGVVVYANVLRDHQGRSRGCGIVEFATPEEAKAAIVQFNDTPLGERNIFVREDREDREDRRSAPPQI